MDTAKDHVKGLAASRAVLLVEDNRDDAMSFHRAFRAAGFENPLRSVHSSDEAMSYLRGEGEYAERALYPMPHMVVIDTTLDGKSGFSLLEWLRQQQKFNGVVVIVLSSDGLPENQEKAIRLGAQAYHQKPASPDELQALISRFGDFWLMGGPFSGD
jgi:two-component system response regulator